MKRRAAIKPARPVKDAGARAPAALSDDPVPEGDELVLVVEELLWGVSVPVMQVLTPLMAPRSWAVLKRSQMVLLVEVVWTLEPPRTSDKELRVTLLMVSTALVSTCQSDSPLKLAGKVQCAHDGGQAGETSDGSEFGVVGQQETATDELEAGERKVVQAGAVDKGQSAASSGQVGSRETLKLVGVESNGTADVGKGWHIDLGNVSEGEVSRIPQVRKTDFQFPAVGGEC